MAAVGPVDVMLPHYGRLDLVQATVRSVLAQDDPEWRLTVVDDTADDAACARLQSWCAGFDDDRVRYLRNERNLGLNRNFARCVTLVRHELAVIIGCDDLMLPNYVATVRSAAAAHPAVAVIQPGVEVVDENGEPSWALVDRAKRWMYAPRPSGRSVMGGEELAASLLRGNWLYFPALCWRSAPLRRAGFREGLEVVLDLDLVLRFVVAGESLLVEPRTCFRYRRHRGSVSSLHAADTSRFAEERAFFLESAERMDDLGWSRAAGVARRHLSSRLNALTKVPAALRSGRRGSARALARHVLAR